MTRKITILVACHKPANAYKNDIYCPIHVGATLSNFKMNMLRDDIGDNISQKNPTYCELTAQYWGWKNLDCEYIGLCHYRRYFKTIITENNIDILLGTNADVILSTPLIEKICMGTRLWKATCREDLEIFLRCLQKIKPEMWETCITFLNNNKCFPYNMFIMKKKEFDKFAEWQFSVLKEMEKYVRLSGYTRMRRIYGYMAEMLLPIWCYHFHLKIKTDDITSMIGKKEIYSSLSPLKKIYRNIIFKLSRDKVHCAQDGDAYMVGFTNDGIVFD